jgi:hypothetical protein
MACTAITFHGVTPAVFDCLKAKLDAGGFPVSGDPDGTLTGDGVTATYSWDGTDSLFVIVSKKPFFISCGHEMAAIKTLFDQTTVVTGAIHDALQACGDSN